MNKIDWSINFNDFLIIDKYLIKNLNYHEY